MTNQQDKEQTQSSPSARKHFKEAPSRFTVMLLMLLFLILCASCENLAYFIFMPLKICITNYYSQSFCAT